MKKISGLKQLKVAVSFWYILAIAATVKAQDLSKDKKIGRVHSCVMSYVEKGAARSNRTVEKFFTDESKLVYITLNECLKGEAMPQVDLSGRVHSKLSYEHHIMGDHLLGFKVVDQKHRFCFPCMYTDNSADWGVLPLHVGSSIRQPASLKKACPLQSKTFGTKAAKTDSRS